MSALGSSFIFPSRLISFAVTGAGPHSAGPDGAGPDGNVAAIGGVVVAGGGSDGGMAVPDG